MFSSVEFHHLGWRMCPPPQPTYRRMAPPLVHCCWLFRSTPAPTPTRPIPGSAHLVAISGILSFPECCINGILQPAAFWDQLFPLSIMPWRITQIIVCVNHLLLHIAACLSHFLGSSTAPSPWPRLELLTSSMLASQSSALLCDSELFNSPVLYLHNS